jgi:uncharacterized protein YggL (DUF469 family)
VGSPPESPLDDDLTLRGDIQTSSAPDLLRSFVGSRETGILTFRNGDIAKSIYMHEGRILFAASTDPDERLGENLLLRGRITARQYREASKLIRPGRRLGAILVELEAIEPDELIPAVEQQVKDLLLDLLTWTHGDYELVIKDVDPASLVNVHISTENVILEGIRRTRSWDRVLHGIGDIESIPVPTGNTEALYKLEMTHEEQEILSHVNGNASVEQICQVSYLSDFETCRILWAFHVLGLIRRGHAGDPVRTGIEAKEKEMDLEDIVEKFNHMFGRVYTFLRGRLGDDIDAFVDGAIDDVSRQYGMLFQGIDLKNYGRVDFDQMLANVADVPADQRKKLVVTGMNELVFVIQLAVRSQRGKDEEAVVSGIIKEGLRRIGVP